MRGRLINPFLAELAQLDTVATAADPDGAGAETSGYDPDFREPIKVTGSDGLPESARRELAPILVPCQVEIGSFEVMQQLASGNTPDSRVVLVFHFADLENMGLVDPSTGEALIRVNDRLIALRRLADESLIQQVRTKSGGLYITEAQPQSFGLAGGDRNLLVCTFEEREQGYRT